MLDALPGTIANHNREYVEMLNWADDAPPAQASGNAGGKAPQGDDDDEEEEDEEYEIEDILGHQLKNVSLLRVGS
jgi:ribosomal protein L12E/L44/L45/RPP1/RPP2